MTDSFLYKMKRVLLLNECSGNQDLAYMFSDADGVRTGKSGYSFGVCQFDIENNWDAIFTLKECGFKPKDLNRLYDQDTKIDDLNAKLVANKSIIDKADDLHIANSIEWCYNVLGEIHLNDITMAMIIDYHNQLRFDRNGKLHTFIKKLGTFATQDDIRNFKLENTTWGKTRPDDVKRRYVNVISVFSNLK